jgi:hypothetical protein
MSKLSERLKALRIDIGRSIKSKKTPPASVTSPIQELRKIGFMDLPAEIRDEIYLLCFETNPILHFARPKSPAESRIKKLMSSRSSTPSTSTKHSLLLVNHQIYQGYKDVADKAADPVFHVTTFRDEQEHMTGKAYWVTRPRMKDWLTSCRIHIDLAQCKGLELYHVYHEIKSDFASFIWEYENLNSVTLTIDCSARGKTGVTRLGEALDAIKISMFITLLQHRPLEAFCVRNGNAVQSHTRVDDQNGWWVEEWPCNDAVPGNGYVCSRNCSTVANKTWYCEDLHCLKETPCNEKCEEQRKKLNVPAGTGLNWLLIGGTGQ